MNVFQVYFEVIGATFNQLSAYFSLDEYEQCLIERLTMASEVESSAEQELEAKILKYESYVNDVLKRDLKQALERLDEINLECVEYLNTKAIIETIIGNQISSNLKTKYDLGCNFYVTAKIADTSMIIVKVGLAIFVELTLPEALDFIDARVKKLEEMADSVDKRIIKIRAYIKVTLQALRELQGITPADSSNRYFDM